METPIIMCLILAGICLVMYALSFTLTLKLSNSIGGFLPKNNAPKLEFECFALNYTCFWIAVFSIVIFTEAYEYFDENGYFALCFTLDLPLLLQPIIYPLRSERNLPLDMRYSFKAVVWIAIFTFVGNYFYTHYFYSVLQAKYTFPAHRINNVPIALFFATHFYFVTYHTFSNLLLRKIESTYLPNIYRTIFFWTTVLAFAYFTAFMETLTISSFPYYSFPPEIKQDIYVKGSAFYGIYFIISFPAFYRLDETKGRSEVVAKGSRKYAPHSLLQVIYESMGTSMIVLIILDLCRVYLNIPLHMEGGLFDITKQ